ncbi:MAG: hypothetical protein IT305_30660 [Chloroflexi bacterium]|nr:hypothetical protein [Chloroflexota bacterium]
MGTIGEVVGQADRTRRDRMGRLRSVGTVASGIVGAGLALLVAYSAATTPKTLPGRPPLYAFDPETVGRLEQRAWVAYYLRQWLHLFDQMLRMIRGVFGLSLPQAVYAAYLNVQAQMVWSRQGAQDGRAEAYMRMFYAYVREPVGGRYDVNTAARLEVAWWAVHRNRGQYPDHSALAAALAATYAEVYQAPAERLLPAGEARAAAMDLSDRWNREGRDPSSPLLEQIATLLVQSYQALSGAVGPSA